MQDLAFSVLNTFRIGIDTTIALWPVMQMPVSRDMPPTQGTFSIKSTQLLTDSTAGLWCCSIPLNRQEGATEASQGQRASGAPVQARQVARTGGAGCQSRQRTATPPRCCRRRRGRPSRPACPTRPAPSRIGGGRSARCPPPCCGAAGAAPPSGGPCARYGSKSAFLHLTHHSSQKCRWRRPAFWRTLRHIWLCVSFLACTPHTPGHKKLSHVSSTLLWRRWRRPAFWRTLPPDEAQCEPSYIYLLSSITRGAIFGSL